jgi:hypothetical protein
MPGLVKAIIADGKDAHKCFGDEEDCILSDRNPDGIPVWKILSFSFWTGPDHPLGRNFTLSPEQYALEGHTPNTYLGYSVEPWCMLQPFIAHHDREDRGYVMAKYLSFVLEVKGDWHPIAWPPHFYEAASNATGIKFVLGAQPPDCCLHPDIPPGLTNHGVMPQAVFLDTVSKSQILIGAGSPDAYVNPSQ